MEKYEMQAIFNWLEVTKESESKGNKRFLALEVLFRLRFDLMNQVLSNLIDEGAKKIFSNRIKTVDEEIMKIIEGQSEPRWKEMCKQLSIGSKLDFHVAIGIYMRETGVPFIAARNAIEEIKDVEND